MFRKKTSGEVIADELHESLSHLGAAVSEAGRAAAQQLAPKVEAAREAAAPALDRVAPKVAAAYAAAAPAVASARENLAPRLEATREAARDAASRAAAEVGPRVEAARREAQRALKDDVVPRLGAAQTAALAYATPRVLAAREAMTPVLETARLSLAESWESAATGLEHAIGELEVRREELAEAGKATRKEAHKQLKKARKQAEKKRRELETRAMKKRSQVKKEVRKQLKKQGRKVRASVGLEPEPRRWPWLIAVLAVVVGAIVLVRRRPTEQWTPAPAGDGPVPSYREDPVPSAPSNADKAVSTAQDMPGDATPPDTDLGSQPQQSAGGGTQVTPGTATGDPTDPALGTATAAPDDQPQTADEASGTEGSRQSLNPQDPA